MKINLRLTCRPDAKTILTQDSVAAKTCYPDSFLLGLDSEDKVLDRILDLTRNTSGIWFNPIMTFTKREMSQARYFQLECRKTVHERDRDYELNFSRMEALEFINTTNQYKIKLLDEIALSRIKLKPNIVAGIDWVEEFLITSTVAKIFDKQQLTGFSLQPIINPKSGKRYKDYFLLYTENIMPQVVPDITIRGFEEVISGESAIRALGCLVYDLREREILADFNRTAEDFSSNYTPLWVVSARVRECFQQNKLRGWAFRPVMEKDSELYNDYLTKWKSLLDRIAINPKNFF